MRLTSEALLLNSLTSDGLENDVESLENTIDPHLESQYSIIIDKIPKELRVYIPA